MRGRATVAGWWELWVVARGVGVGRWGGGGERAVEMVCGGGGGGGVKGGEEKRSYQRLL